MQFLILNPSTSPALSAAEELPIPDLAQFDTIPLFAHHYFLKKVLFLSKQLASNAGSHYARSYSSRYLSIVSRFAERLTRATRYDKNVYKFASAALRIFPWFVRTCVIIPSIEELRAATPGCNSYCERCYSYTSRNCVRVFTKSHIKHGRLLCKRLQALYVSCSSMQSNILGELPELSVSKRTIPVQLPHIWDNSLERWAHAF